MDARRDLGQYMTPESIARQMCDLIQRPVAEWRILDPACGDGNLLLAAAEAMRGAGVTNIHEHLMGIDIDPLMVARARKRLADALGCDTEIVRIVHGDFLEMFAGGLFSAPPTEVCTYNTVLANPPYGRLREYRFFELSAAVSPPGTELVFLLPLAFADRVSGVTTTPLLGRPMGVTTGHVIVYHTCGHTYQVHRVSGHRMNTRAFRVLSGVKLYEVGAGDPPQTDELLAAKPYSSAVYHAGWLPCLRTGDVHPYSLELGRLWVHYGPHLAHPKELARFTGPRLVVRRMPIWASRQLGVAYIEEPALCAGDMLVVRHKHDDIELLKGLCVYLNSRSAAESIFQHRPSVQLRMSYPKISAKDLNRLLTYEAPSDEELRIMAREHPAHEVRTVANPVGEPD